MSKRITELDLLMTRLPDKESFSAWITTHLGVTLPDQVVSRYADSSPLDFAWKIYCAMEKGESLAILGLAGRSSGKTLALAIVALMAALHFKRGIVHLGMTRPQASRCKQYISKFVHKHPILKAFIVKENATNLTLMVDGEEVGMEILPATQGAVQGAHCSVLSFDELASSTTEENRNAIRDAHGILTSTTDGDPGIVIKITSRQSSHSLAEDELKNAPKTGIQINRWTTLECTERCPDERSGTKRTALWVNTLKDLVYTEREFEHIPKNEREGFVKTRDTFDKCRNCPVASLCLGDLKKQKSESNILRTIDDLAMAVNLSGSHDWALSQIMSLRPDTQGLIYPEFSRSIHIPGWNVMWARLTGENATFQVTRSKFIQKCKELEVEFIAGVDFGVTAAATCIVLAIDRQENVYVVDAMARKGLADPDWVELIRTEIHPKYDVQAYCPDPENPSAIILMTRASLPVRKVDKGKGSVRAGINTVKRFLRVPGSNHETRFFIAPDIVPTIPNVPGLVEEFELYRYRFDGSGQILEGEPQKGADHHLDGTRYALHWRFGKIAPQALFMEALPPLPGPPVIDSSTPFDPVQLATSIGIPFLDNRHEFPEPGSGEKEEMIRWPGNDDDDDDPDGNGSGGSGLQIA